jgi:hypothetical protein
VEQIHPTLCGQEQDAAAIGALLTNNEHELHILPHHAPAVGNQVRPRRQHDIFRPCDPFGPFALPSPAARNHQNAPGHHPTAVFQQDQVHCRLKPWNIKEVRINNHCYFEASPTRSQEPIPPQEPIAPMIMIKHLGTCTNLFCLFYFYHDYRASQQIAYSSLSGTIATNGHHQLRHELERVIVMQWNHMTMTMILIGAAHQP